MGYAQLVEHFRRLSHLEHVGAILHWDDAVLRSPGGGQSRAEAAATLGREVHKKRVDPRLRDWLAAAEQESLGELERENLREMRRAHLRASALPSDLVEALSRATSLCEQGWRSQRATGDFAAHRPLLEEVVRLSREQATVLGAALGVSPYDALLDGFEPGFGVADFEPVFDELSRRLPPLLQRIEEKQAGEDCVVPQGPFAIAAQRELGLELMKELGFDFDRGRLDVSHHPFCGGVPDDVRVTTRYDEADFTSALMGVLHETGHAKYEQGLPAELRGQPAGLARSMAVHESQSLLTEMQVCRSSAFVRRLAPRLPRFFPAAAAAQPEAFAEANLVRLYTRVERGYIRVDADEVTYPMHILLRTRLERALIEGHLSVAELPEAWDAAMRELLGLSTGDDHRDGCMQDVHWPAGAFGYFPSYTLGALLAAQLFAAARRDLPDLDAAIESGDFAALNGWLARQIWQQASRLETRPLVARATGAPLSVEPFLAHVEARYLAE